MFVSTAVGSVSGVVADYAWKDLAGQGLWVPGLMLWTMAAVIASAPAASLTAWAPQPVACGSIPLAGGGFARGQAAWTIGRSQAKAPDLLSAGVDLQWTRPEVVRGRTCGRVH